MSHNRIMILKAVLLISGFFCYAAGQQMNETSENNTAPPPRHDDKKDYRAERVYESLSADYGTPDFILSSPAVENGQLLKQFKGEKKENGIEKSIPLSWKNVPEKTKSLAIVMYHYPHPSNKLGVNSYLLLWGINPSVTEIPYGEAISDDWYMGRNKDGNAISYTSPNSQGPETHEYRIAIFALSEYPDDLPKKSTLDVDFSTFMNAVENTTIIGKGELVFTVEGNKNAEKVDRKPPRQPKKDKQSDKENRGLRDSDGQKYSLSQAVSDNAQLHTIAFNALAFFTGDASADTFFPPGKVSDFFGFQYFRDIDSGGMGHNTTFVPRVANNILAVLTDEQIKMLTALAEEQERQLTAYGYGRYPLMAAFRRNMEQNYPAGKTALDRDAVISYSADLYGIDGELSYNRARVLGGIIASLSDTQRARFDEMAEGGSDTWGFPDDQVDKKSLSPAAHVLVMTYASEMFTWYAGNTESDTYFCPERHGTYYGGFYMKDAPVMDDPEFFIDTNATGGSGEAMLGILTPDQALKITSLVDLQRNDIQGIVTIRRRISGELRQFMKGDPVNKDEIMSMMAEYGRIDGEINYLYATTFAEVFQTLTDSQKKALQDLRMSQGFEPAEAYLFAEPVSYPSDVAYGELFK